MTTRRRIQTTPSDYVELHGKIPPQAIDLEDAVIGSVMLEPNSLDVVIGYLSPDVFYKSSNQIIFKAVLDLQKDNKPFDILSVTQHLRKTGELEAAGGPYAITTMCDRIGSTANIDFQGRIILQKFMQRELIRVSTEIIKEAFEDTTDVFDLTEKAELEISKVTEMQSAGADGFHIGILATESIKGLRTREDAAKRGKMTGIETPIKELNRKTHGWQNDDLIIWASRPGMGKTAALIQMAKAAAKIGVPVCIYEMEMSGVRLADRLILSETNVDSDRFRSGYVTKDDWMEIEKATKYIQSLPIYVHDEPIQSMRRIRAHAKRMQKKGLCGMIMIDYLQLADMRLDEKGRNREQEVAAASRDAKLTAKILHVPVHLLAQLSRRNETRGGNMRPMLSDLRESGAIEQDADMVIFIHRPEYYGVERDEEGTSTKGVGEMIIAKNREGDTGIVLFRYNPSLTKFTDYDRDIDRGGIPMNLGFTEPRKEYPQDDTPF